MNLYRSLGHIWTGTQKDAKAAGEYEAIDVPTDKAGLLAFLNELQPKPQLEQAPEPTQWTEEEYRNGLPTTVFNKSRDPAAVFNCTACGHQNRNQGQ